MVTLAEAVGGKDRIVGGPFGSKLTQNDYRENGVPVIRGSNMGGAGRWVTGPFAYVSQQKLKLDLISNVAAPGNIIVTQRGTLGQVAVIRDDGPFDAYVVSQSQMAINVDRRIADRDFVYYFLTSPIFNNFVAVATIQTGVPHINLGLLRDVEVDWPELDDQRTTASILGMLDDKIDLNRRMNETLEAMAQAIFKDWFVDFGPIRAKMEGRAPYLLPECWDIFPDSLDSEGTPIGWTRARLFDQARLTSGGTPKTENPAFWNGDIPWASAKDVSQCPNQFLISTERAITERGLRESATRIIPALATVVVARGATTGRYCMFGRDMAMNQTCYALASLHDRPFWLNCAFGSFVEALVQEAHGSVFDTITTGTLERVRLKLPPPAVLDAFEANVRPMFLKVLAGINESQTLAQTRDLLLPKLLSGELRVRDAERAIEDVL